jgi:hypothetical protein
MRFTRMHAELGVQVPDVIVDGIVGNAHSLGDGFVAHPLRQEKERLPLRPSVKRM